MTLGAAQPAADGHVEAGNVDSVAASVLLAPCTQSFAALRLTQVGEGVGWGGAYGIPMRRQVSAHVCRVHVCYAGRLRLGPVQSRV